MPQSGTHNIEISLWKPRSTGIDAITGTIPFGFVILCTLSCVFIYIKLVDCLLLLLDRNVPTNLSRLASPSRTYREPLSALSSTGTSQQHWTYHLPFSGNIRIHVSSHIVHLYICLQVDTVGVIRTKMHVVTAGFEQHGVQF